MISRQLKPPMLRCYAYLRHAASAACGAPRSRSDMSCRYASARHCCADVFADAATRAREHQLRYAMLRDIGAGLPKDAAHIMRHATLPRAMLRHASTPMLTLTLPIRHARAVTLR